jgi:hypothetical protein
MFNEDQKDRSNWLSMTPTEWEPIAKQDAARRQRVSEMLRAGDVKSAEDYERAAFIFQHGSEPSDYLLAHALAMTAMAVDAGHGPWIATATLDRYLNSIGKPQIFGTQLDDKAPFDENLVPQAVAAANCVPSPTDRRRIMEAIAKKTAMPVAGPCQPKVEDFNGRWSVIEKMPDGKVVQGVLDLRAKEDDFVATLRLNGRKTELEDVSMADRELKFRIGAQEYRLKVHAGMMSGSFSAPGGLAGQLVGLR